MYLPALLPAHTQRALSLLPNLKQQQTTKNGCADRQPIMCLLAQPTNLKLPPTTKKNKFADSKWKLLLTCCCCSLLPAFYLRCSVNGPLCQLVKNNNNNNNYKPRALVDDACSISKFNITAMMVSRRQTLGFLPFFVCVCVCV